MNYESKLAKPNSESSVFAQADYLNNSVGDTIDAAAERLFNVQYPDRSFERSSDRAKISWMRRAWKERLSPSAEPSGLIGALEAARSLAERGATKPGIQDWRSMACCREVVKVLDQALAAHAAPISGDAQ